MALIRNGARMSNTSTSKVVSFGDNVEKTNFCGVVSQITWNNPDLMTGLRTMFGCKKDEVIVAIEVTDVGIRAKFERS